MAGSIYFAAATLDGYIADPDDGLDWLTGFEPTYDGPGEDVNEAIDAFMETVGAIVMGSSTYEFILAHGSWAYGERPTWVLTSRELPVAGADIRFHDGPVADIHSRCSPPPASATSGSWAAPRSPPRLAAPACSTSSTSPSSRSSLGAGTPSSRPRSRGPMRLLGTRTFATGMVELRYSLER